MGGGGGGGMHARRHAHRADKVMRRGWFFWVGAGGARLAREAQGDWREVGHRSGAALRVNLELAGEPTCMGGEDGWRGGAARVTQKGHCGGEPRGWLGHAMR